MAYFISKNFFKVLNRFPRYTASIGIQTETCKLKLFFFLFPFTIEVLLQSFNVCTLIIPYDSLWFFFFHNKIIFLNKNTRLGFRKKLSTVSCWIYFYHRFWLKINLILKYFQNRETAGDFNLYKKSMMKYDRHINIDVAINMNVITVVFTPHLGNKTFLIPVPL